MVRTVLLCFAIGWMLSCSDDAAPPGRYGEQCAGADCAEGLRCIRGGSENGICTISCSGTAECRAISDVGICSGGHCYDACTDNFQCSGGNMCVMFGTPQGTCRPQ